MRSSRADAPPLQADSQSFRFASETQPGGDMTSRARRCSPTPPPSFSGVVAAGVWPLLRAERVRLSAAR